MSSYIDLGLKKIFDKALQSETWGKVKEEVKKITTIDTKVEMGKSVYYILIGVFLVGLSLISYGRKKRK